MSIELGAYVLHALEDDEDEQVRRHVADCGLCQDEVRDLSFTVSVLALLTPEHLDQLGLEEGDPTPSGTVPEAASLSGRARPGRRHRPIMLAVAAVLAATLAIPASRALDQAASTTPSTVISAADPTTHVEAAVTLARQAGGTRIRLSLSGAYPKGWCSLVARSRDGRQDIAATWRADAQGTAEVAGTTAIPTDRLRELDVVTDAGVVLVTIPMPGPEA